LLKWHSTDEEKLARPDAHVLSRLQKELNFNVSAPASSIALMTAAKFKVREDRMTNQDSEEDQEEEDDDLRKG
jgi:hypothetical protein